MTQPLNYTPKAIEALISHACPGAPGTAAGNRYIADKLREAQVFVLSDHGQLLDRSKPRPDVPSSMYKPPFDVVALEYEAARSEWGTSPYDEVACSKRIALAWAWNNDLPPLLRDWQPERLGPGVVVASVAYHDEAQQWLVIPAAMHIAYDDADTGTAPAYSPFRDAMIAAGRIPKATLKQPTRAGKPIVISPETVVGATASAGSVAAVIDMLTGDVMDEVNAYLDLTIALACKNVRTREKAAPKFLNRQRIKKGKLPLKGFHVLELTTGGEMPSGGGTVGDRSGPRSHLRRGHIRRLSGERVTWVNSTIVQGRGFVDKVYAA